MPTKGDLMDFFSDTKKMAQAVGVLLHEEPDQRTSYMRVLKLLVIADREALEKAGRPIIGSRVVAMKDGPLHSVVYDLIKNEHPDVPMWDSYFDTVGKFDIQMHDNPGVDQLSRFEVELLQGVSRERAWMDQWALSEETHKFRDWERAWSQHGDKGSVPIPLESTLHALGLDEDADAIMSGVRTHNVASRLLG